MKARREVQPNAIKSIINMRPVKDDRGNHKKDAAGRRIFHGSNHAELVRIKGREEVRYHPHPESYEFVIV